MKYVKPVEITDGVLTSNVPDGDYPDWIAGAYNQGDRVVVGLVIYEALANTTDEPVYGTSLPVPTWLRLGYINRWRMFTNASDSRTVNPVSISVDLDTGQLISTVAALGCEGQQVTVTQTDPIDGVVYQRTEQLQDIGVSDWWEYYFTDYGDIDDVVFSGIPPNPTAVINITVTALSGQDAEVGLVNIGTARTLGVTTYGTAVGSQNFSVRERDGFGNLTITPRRSIDIVNYDVKVPTSQVAFVKRELQAVANSPTLFIGDENFEATIIYGVVEDFRENISTPSVSDMTVEVRSI